METKHLHKSIYINSIKGLIVIPFGVFSADLVSRIVCYANKGSIDNVKKISAILIIFIFIYQLAILFINILSEQMIEKSNQKFRMYIYNSFLDKPIDKSKTTGVLIKSFTKDVNEIIKLYSSTIPSIITNTLTIIAYILFIGISSFKLAVILLTIGIIQIIPHFIIKKFMVKNYDANIEIEGKITDYIVEGCKGISTIKLLTLYDYYLNGLKKLNKTYLKVGSKSELTSQSQNAMESAIDIILRFGTYSLVGLLLIKNIITLDTVTKAIILSKSLYSSMNSVFLSIPLVAVSKKAKERLIQIFEKTEKQFKGTNINFESYKGTNIFQIENLSFRYGENVILNDVSFNVNRGDIVVLQGLNGSGKSTLVNILTGIYRDYNGSVKFVGKELNKLDFNEYYELISCLLQDEYGFCMSLNEFLDILVEGEVLNKDEAISFTQKLNMNEQVLTNERINKLSGGEKKKIYLIASLLKNSNILFLDEPGNSLDVEGKCLLKEYIIKSKKTVVLITHDEFFFDIATLRIKLDAGIANVVRAVV